MAVSKGRIVLVRLREAGRPLMFNGSDEHPAIVTHVHWGGADERPMINARVLIDWDGVPPWRTSIPHARHAAPGYQGDTWRWPPRDEGEG